MKKIILAAAALILMGNSFAFAQEAVFLTPDEIKTQLTRDQQLPSMYLAGFGSRAVKDELCNLADQQIKKNRTYTAYYNAAVIYLNDSEYSVFPHDITRKDMLTAQKYATAAISISPDKAEPYILRGLAAERFLNIDALEHSSLYQDKVTPAIQKEKTLALRLIEDYEKALQINPYLPLHAILAEFHRALGHTQKAKFYDDYVRAQTERELRRQQIKTKNDIKKALQAQTKSGKKNRSRKIEIYRI